MSPDHARIPEWFSDLLDLDHPPGEGEIVGLSGKRYRVDGGILRAGTDISTSVDVAAARCADAGVAGAFVQDDLLALPLPARSVDVVFAEGMLHHTDSTRNALLRLAELLHPGGRFLFYLYKKKSPIREFTDDYIRALLQEMQPEDAWKALEPLMQRLFYWHVAKAFYHPDLTFDELTHINYDWYAPANAHRQTPEEVRAWCDEAGLEIEREQVEEAGITVIARRRD